MFNAYSVNTLRLDETRCTGCGICVNVCPHAVFEKQNRIVHLVAPHSCMECGACQRNCPFGAIQVESGVGCAGAMMRSALSGKKELVCD